MSRLWTREGFGPRFSSHSLSPTKGSQRSPRSSPSRRRGPASPESRPSHSEKIIRQLSDVVSRTPPRTKLPRGACGLTGRVSRFAVVPVLAQPVLPRPPLALGLVPLQDLRRRQGRLPELVARLVVLARVPLALARGDHGDLVGPRGAVQALQLDALRAGLVVDAPPVLAAAPASPPLPAVRAADPVLEHLGREALAGAHQLLDGVDAGAVAVGDVLGGPQLSAANLASLCGKTEINILKAFFFLSCGRDLTAGLPSCRNLCL